MLIPRAAKHLLAFRKDPIWFGMEVAYVFFIVQSPPKKKSNNPAVTSGPNRPVLNLRLAAPVMAILLSKNKKRLKNLSFLRRVKQTRGTTQIAKIDFATSSKSGNFYALTQHARETSTG